MDDILTQRFFWGAVGSIATLVAKYVFDRLTESHRAQLSLSAKRRERFHNKQAEVVAGTYERLAVAMKSLRALVIFDSDVGTPLSKHRAINLREDLSRVRETFEAFDNYLATNEIYLPESLVKHMNMIKPSKDVMQISYWLHIEDEEMPIVPADVDRTRKTHEQVDQLLGELKIRFRRLMLEDDYGPQASQARHASRGRSWRRLLGWGSSGTASDSSQPTGTSAH